MGNTGKKINPVLKKVVDGGPFDGQPLDDNNILTSISGLPQDIIPNPVESDDYKVDDPITCPPDVQPPDELETYPPKYVINTNYSYCEAYFRGFSYSNVGTSEISLGISINKSEFESAPAVFVVEDTSSGNLDSLNLTQNLYLIRLTSNTSIPWPPGTQVRLQVKVDGAVVFDETSSTQSAIIKQFEIALYAGEYGYNIVEVSSFIIITP